MNGRKKPFGNQHEDDKHEHHFWIKPVERPSKIHRTPYKNSGKNEKNFLSIEIKWT